MLWLAPSVFYGALNVAGVNVLARTASHGGDGWRLAAVRCRFDRDKGAGMADSVPHYQGLPVQNMDQATDLFADGPNPDVQMLPVRRRIVWET